MAASVLEAKASVPVLRVGTLDEAELVARLLGEAELGSAIVPDAALALQQIPRRVRELRLEEDRLSLLVLWGDWVSIPRDEVRLAVEGRITSTSVELVEHKGKVKSQPELVSTSQFTSEYFAIDLYGPSLAESFRVKAESFDFSCLGRPAQYLEANVNWLGRALWEYLGPSRYDLDYKRLSRLLVHAWPPPSRVDTRGRLHRGDFKRYSLSAIQTDGYAQFDRYSRTRYALCTGG
jgi:hypothetical protein